MATANTAPAPIIEARTLEKSYPQPDGSRIQVIAPTDLAVYPGKLETYSLCSPNRIPIFRCLC